MFVPCKTFARRDSEDALNRSDRRQPSPTNPLWRRIGRDRGTGMGRCQAARSQSSASSACPSLHGQTWSCRHQYLGPRPAECKKAVRRCAVCSELGRSFKPPQCRNTLCQGRNPKTRIRIPRITNLEVPVKGYAALFALRPNCPRMTDGLLMKCSRSVCSAIKPRIGTESSGARRKTATGSSFASKSYWAKAS